MALNKMMKLGCGGLVLSSAAMGADMVRTDKVIDIQAKVRVDSVSAKTDTKLNAGTQTDTEDGFKLAMARLYLLGAANEGRTRYTLNIDPLKISDVAKSSVANVASGSKATSDVDGANTVLAEASLTHMPMKMLAIKLGRMGVNAGGVENNFYGPFDTYLGSYHSNLAEISQAATGAELAVMPMEGHTIKIQVLNGLQGSPAAEKAGGSMTTGLAYQGDVAGMMKPYVSVYQHRYTKAKYATAKAGTETLYDQNNAMSYSVGAQFMVADLTIDGEYNGINWAKTKTVVNGNSVDDPNAKTSNYSGGIIQVAYKVPSVGLRPWLKLTNETHKKGAVNNVGDIAYMSYGIGAEWFVEKNLNYHVAYTSANTTTKNADADTSGAIDLKSTVSTVLVGGGIHL